MTEFILTLALVAGLLSTTTLVIVSGVRVLAWCELAPGRDQGTTTTSPPNE